MNSSLLGDLQRGLALRRPAGAAAAADEGDTERVLLPLTKQNRIDIVSLSMKLKRLIPAEDSLENMVLNPPPGLQLALLHAASPQLFHLVTISNEFAMPTEGSTTGYDDSTARESGLSGSPLNMLHMYEHCNILSFLSINELFMVGSLCKYFSICLSQPLLLTAASQGLLRIGDPLLVNLRQPTPTTARDGAPLKIQRGKPIIQTLTQDDSGDAMWGPELLLEIARSLNIVKKLSTKDVSEEVAKEAKQPLCSRVATMVQSLQEKQYADLRVSALYLLCIIRSELLKEKQKLSDLGRSLACLNHPDMREIMAQAVSTCSQIGDLLERPETVDDADRVECPPFPLSALDSIRDVKSRYHPHFTLHEALTHVLLTHTACGLRDPLPVDHPLVSATSPASQGPESVSKTCVRTPAQLLNTSCQAVLKQFNNLLAPPPQRSIRAVPRFLREMPGGPPPPPDHSPLSTMKRDVRDMRTQLKMAIASLEEVEGPLNSERSESIRGLKHLQALLTFVDYEFAAIEEKRLRLVQQYIELREFVNCGEGVGASSTPALPVIVDGQLAESMDGRNSCFSFLRFMTALTTDMPASHITWQEATVSCELEQEEQQAKEAAKVAAQAAPSAPPPPSSTPPVPSTTPQPTTRNSTTADASAAAKSSDTATAVDDETSSADDSKQRRRSSTSKVSELRDQISLRLSRHQAPAPPLPKVSVASLRESVGGGNSRKVKRWHCWGDVTAQTVDSPLFHLARSTAVPGNTLVPQEVKKDILKLFAIGAFVGMKRVRKHTMNSAPVFSNLDFTNERSLKGRALVE